MTIDEVDYGNEYFNAPDEVPQIRQLFEQINNNKETLKELYERSKSHYWVHGFYRFYHGSFKVYGVQKATLEIVDLFESLMTEFPLHEDFLAIVSQGTGKLWLKEDNRNWLAVTRPMLEAYWHAMMFLECMLVCIEEMDVPRCAISQEWGAVLYLYQLRQA